MATKYSQILQDKQASPNKLVPAQHDGGRVRVATATIEIAADDNDGDILAMVHLPSNASVKSIRLSADAITGGTSFDVGLYDTLSNGGAAVDVDAYASAVTLASGADDLEVAFEARDIAAVNNFVWQDAGLSSDPSKEMAIALTGNTIGTVAGTVTLAVYYTDGAS